MATDPRLTYDELARQRMAANPPKLGPKAADPFGELIRRNIEIADRKPSEFVGKPGENPFVGLGESKSTAPVKPIPAMQVIKSVSPIGSAMSSQDQADYRRQVEAAPGGRVISARGGQPEQFEMDTNVPVSASDLGAYVHRAGLKGNPNAFSPENIASARAAAQAHQVPVIGPTAHKQRMAGIEGQAALAAARKLAGMAPSERGSLSANQIVGTQQRNALQLANQRQFGGISPEDTVNLMTKLATHNRAEEKAAFDREDRFIEQSKTLDQETANNFPWMVDDGASFFSQAYKAGETNPRRALNTLAGVYQNIAQQEDEFVNVAGEPISGQDAIAILNGKKPFWGIGSDFYKAARQAIADRLQQVALSNYNENQ
jgi:hypothetical protein